MEFFIPWVALSVLAGWIAAQKGRSGVGFFFLAVILSPLVGIIAALVVAPNKNSEPQEKGEMRVGINGELEAIPSTKSCPFCAETIKIEAIVCKHCGRDLPREQPASA